MIPNLPPLTITGNTPVPLIDVELLRQLSPTTNAYKTDSGYSLLLATDGVLFIGNSEMDRTNTSSFDAGVFPLSLKDDEVPYALPVIGQTVHVKRLGQGFKGADTGVGVGSGGGFGEGGFG